MIKLYRRFVVSVLTAAEMLTDRDYSRLESYRRGYSHGILCSDVYRPSEVRHLDYYRLGHEHGKELAEKN